MRYFLMSLPMMLAVLYAEGTSMSRMNTAPAPWPSDPIAYGVMGLMVVSVMISFGMLANRVRELEKKIADIETPPH
jgi:hypothetical protein